MGLNRFYGHILTPLNLTSHFWAEMSVWRRSFHYNLMAKDWHKLDHYVHYAMSTQYECAAIAISSAICSKHSNPYVSISLGILYFQIFWFVKTNTSFVCLFTILRLTQEFSLIRGRHHCQWRAAKFRPMLGVQGLWARRDLYRVTPAATRDLSFSGLIRRTAPFSRLLRHTRGCGGSSLTRILTRRPMNDKTKEQFSF